MACSGTTLLYFAFYILKIINGEWTWSYKQQQLNGLREKYLEIKLKSRNKLTKSAIHLDYVGHVYICNTRFIISKVNLSRYTPWRCLEGEGYSSYSFLTSELDGGEWSASRPGRALPPGKGSPLPIGQEAGWSPEPVWTQRLEEKFSGIEPRSSSP
jgi:hypothetical protein